MVSRELSRKCDPYRYDGGEEPRETEPMVVACGENTRRAKQMYFPPKATSAPSKADGRRSRRKCTPSKANVFSPQATSAPSKADGRRSRRKCASSKANVFSPQGNERSKQSGCGFPASDERSKRTGCVFAMGRSSYQSAWHLSPALRLPSPSARVRRRVSIGVYVTAVAPMAEVHPRCFASS